MVTILPTSRDDARARLLWSVMAVTSAPLDLSAEDLRTACRTVLDADPRHLTDRTIAAARRMIDAINRGILT